MMMMMIDRPLSIITHHTLSDPGMVCIVLSCRRNYFSNGSIRRIGLVLYSFFCVFFFVSLPAGPARPDRTLT